MPQPITFYVGHQGRGHANRAMAIIDALPAERAVTILTARPALFDGFARPVTLVPLPDEGAASDSPPPALAAQPTPDILHRAPIGDAAIRATMRTILDHLDTVDPALFVVDVSAEIALLARIASVPAIGIRMHGNRGDAAHLAGYRACVGLLAPFDEALEQPETPDWIRAMTHYAGGLCTARDVVPGKAEARAMLGLSPDREIVVVLTGGGGAGTPYAPLTMAARALPETDWLVLGPVQREGHETDFGNLHLRGWVATITAHIAAADVVVASSGDTIVHEIARVGRPYVCAPEWRYFDEQMRKGERLAELGAAILVPSWPGASTPWRGLLDAAKALDPAALASLHTPTAAASAADYLDRLATDLWTR